MKKVVSFFLSVFVFVFAFVGCGMESELPKDETTIRYTTEGKKTKLVPDERLTGELTVSCAIGKEDAVVAATIFNRLYPNVKLDLETIGEESFADYCTKLSTAIMAGNGPDLFWIGTGFDMNKMMRYGVFADMHDYFENDKNFNIDDYNKAVFCGGQPEGKQYITPIRYSVPLVMTTKSIADESGLDILKCDDYLGFIKETEKAFLKMNSAGKKTKFFGEPYALTLFPQVTGFNWIDYDNIEVNINNDEVKEVCEFIKKYFNKEVSSGFKSENYYESALALKNKENMLADFYMVGANKAFESMRLMLYFNEEPLPFEWRNMNGKTNASSIECVAVGNNSKNKQNAYNFLKILLSTENQILGGHYSYTIPVSNVAMNQIAQEQKKELEIYYGGETGNIVLPPLP